MPTRGTGSLQQLLGRSTFGSSTRQKKRSPDGLPLAVSDQTSSVLPVSPLKSNHVRCPVCQRQIRYKRRNGEEDEYDDGKVNEHLDKCLAAQRMRVSKRQATLRGFEVIERMEEEESWETEANEELKEAVLTRSAYDTKPERERKRERKGESRTISGTEVEERTFDRLQSCKQNEVGAACSLASSSGDSNPPEQVVMAKLKCNGEEKHPNNVSDTLIGTQNEGVVSNGERSWSCDETSIKQTPAEDEKKTETSSRMGNSPETRILDIQTRPFIISFSTCVVGRRFQKGGATVSPRLQSGDRVLISPEPSNPRDENALLVKALVDKVEKASKPDDEGEAIAIGHIPRTVAKHLSPLLKEGAAEVEGFVQRGPLDAVSPLDIEIHIIALEKDLEEDSEHCCVDVDEVYRNTCLRIRRTVVAIQNDVAENENPKSANTFAMSSGQRLRKNFHTVLEVIKAYESSVLCEDEWNFINTYERLSEQSQSLFLRLAVRTRSLFRLSTLMYEDVPDVGSASKELDDAGLLQFITLDHIDVRKTLADVATAKETNLSSLLSSDLNHEATVNMPGSMSWDDLVELLTVHELMIIVQSTDQILKRMDVSMPISFTRSNKKSVLSFLGRCIDSDNAAVRTAIRHEINERLGTVLCMRKSSSVVMARLQRLFFLNEGQTLSHFLAKDCGAVRYPAYKINRTCAVFLDRKQLLDYERALDEAEKMTLALEENDFDLAMKYVSPAWVALEMGIHKAQYFAALKYSLKPSGHQHRYVAKRITLDESSENENECCRAVQWSGVNANTSESRAQGTNGGLLPPFLRRFHAAWVYCLMATAGISILERRKRYGEAVERLFQLLGGHCCPSKRGYWWLRLSIDLDHLGRPTDALEIAETGLADESLSPGDVLALRRRVLRLAKPPRRWRKPAWASIALREPKEVRVTATPLNSVPGMKSVFVGLDGQPCSVEELALQHYALPENGSWRGMHSEGGIWATLFGLLLWPVLFSDGVEDTFRTPFQTAPLDLDTEGFYPARSTDIESLLCTIAEGKAREILEETWGHHQGTLCRGVQWNRWSLEELIEIADCIKGVALAAVCRLLAKDHAGWAGGMPDLFLYNTERREALLSEVKGPRDRLSDQQRAWIAALEDAGLGCEVLKVTEKKSHAKRK